jgi:gamma-glutamylcyclotransferase (GGCT)/AIG2-like uncharacterized protein YtfP
MMNPDDLCLCAVSYLFLGMTIKKEIQAWMYFWNRSVDSLLQKIDHGDYRKHCS